MRYIFFIVEGWTFTISSLLLILLDSSHWYPCQIFLIFLGHIYSCDLDLVLQIYTTEVLKSKHYIFVYYVLFSFINCLSHFYSHYRKIIFGSSSWFPFVYFSFNQSNGIPYLCPFLKAKENLNLMYSGFFLPCLNKILWILVCNAYTNKIHITFEFGLL